MTKYEWRMNVGLSRMPQSHWKSTGLTDLRPFGRDWEDLLRQTPGASFFQSLQWLEVYWRHFGAGQKLRVLVVQGEDRPAGILPLVVRRENRRSVRSACSPFPCTIGAPSTGRLVPTRPRRWPPDWNTSDAPGGTGTSSNCAGRGPSAPIPAKPNAPCWPPASKPIQPSGTARRSSISTGRGRRTGRRGKGPGCGGSATPNGSSAEQGEVGYVRYRPAGPPHDDGSPRWDLYDACEELARRSWQAAATNGTTLRTSRSAASCAKSTRPPRQAGAVDLNLLLLDGSPVAFIYGYHYRGYVYGLRRGYDAERAPEGAGNVLLAYTLRDSFARGDRLYDMGVGSLESKRHFQTRVIPVLRLQPLPAAGAAHATAAAARWWQGTADRRRRPSRSAAFSDGTADAR